MNLDRTPVPDERGAEERAWRVVRSAYDERIPSPRPRRHVRALALAAAAIALAAAAASPPGRAVLGNVRDTVVGERHAAPALFSLPAAGRVLVDSADGPWVVERNGSRRLLGDYREASWSPHGLFVVASRANELVATEPNGDVHWSLARRDVRFPRWGGSRVDTRIAYLSGSRLHVVVGNGTKDVDECGLPAAAKVAPAWRPGDQHVLAYVDTRGRISLFEADTCGFAWRSDPVPGVRSLAWRSDGSQLLVVARDGLLLFTNRSRKPVARVALAGVVGAAFAPTGNRIAVARPREVLVLDADRPSAPTQRVFAGAGPFTSLAWSPDGRWLLVPWPSADQWIFVRTGARRRVLATSSISQQFGGSFPTLAGWCCTS